MAEWWHLFLLCWNQGVTVWLINSKLNPKTDVFSLTTDFLLWMDLSSSGVGVAYSTETKTLRCGLRLNVLFIYFLVSNVTFLSFLFSSWCTGTPLALLRFIFKALLLVWVCMFGFSLCFCHPSISAVVCRVRACQCCACAYVCPCSSTVLFHNHRQKVTPTR